MIAGRPTNLWLGLTTAVSGAVVATLIALGFDPVVVGTLGGVWGGVLGAAILLIANQPPTLAPGDTFKVTCTAPRLYPWSGHGSKSLVKVTKGIYEGRYVSSLYAREV